jgi:membrane-bound serine protease (ClpP class)
VNRPMLASARRDSAVYNNPMKGIAKWMIAAGALIWVGWQPISHLTGADAGAATRIDRVVWLVALDGALGPATADLIIRSIEAAEDAGAEALIIRMDTPGGLDKSMRELVQAILAARIPVITYVAPEGARAASAGTYIAYASHVAAMAPATNIGSSTPVSIGPTPTFPTPAPEGEEEDAPPPPADAMTRKIINDAVAYLQGMAELRGRNIEWAEETVREGANLRSSEALERNVIDVIAGDVPELLEAIDGWEIALDRGVATLETAGAVLHRVETDWKHDLLELITDPTIAYGLLIFGVYGLILEFYNPGMIFPSVIGIVCLLLGAYGLQMLPVNYAGLALILVGIGMMVAEVFTPTMGALGITGVVAFVLGSLMLLDTESPEFGLPIAVIAAFAATTAGLVLFAAGAAVKARHASIRTGKESMLGQRVEVLEGFSGEGRVRAFGEIWRARATAPVTSGRTAEVVDVDGLTLVVEPVDDTKP